MSLALLFLYLMHNMIRMLIYPFSGACYLFVELLHGLYFSGSKSVGVILWFGWGGVVSVGSHSHSEYINRFLTTHLSSSQNKAFLSLTLPYVKLYLSMP